MKSESGFSFEMASQPFRVMDCMSEKNILANLGGSNSASFESQTHDP